MLEVYTNLQLNCYWYPPWKSGALRRSRPILLAPDFWKFFRRADSNEGRLADGLATENCFLQHQDSPALACSCSFLDLTQLDYNKKDQASHAPPQTAHLSPQQYQRCGQLFGVQSHQQLMRQRFPHWTNAPVYLSSPSSVIKFSRGTTSNRQLRG